MKMSRFLVAALCALPFAAYAQIGGGGISGPSPANGGATVTLGNVPPQVGRPNLHALPRVNIRDYNVTPASSAASVTAAFVAADAYLAANGGGMITIPNDGTYKLATGFVASDFVGIEGGESIIPTTSGAAPRGVGPHIECQTISTACVTVGHPDASHEGGAINNLIVSYNGTPVAGAHAVVIQGHNTQCQNVMVYNAWDAFTFQQGLSAHCSGLYTANIYNRHIVQDGFPEVYVSQSRFGMNGPGDQANSESYIGQTGHDPNGFLCDQCQFNLGNQSPHHLVDYYDLTSQINGLVTISNSVADMTIGNCQSLIKTDSSSFVNRLLIISSTLNAPTCPMLDQSAQLKAPVGLKILDNLLIAVSDITIDTAGAGDLSFDISHNKIIGNVALNSGDATSQGIYSKNKLLGNLTVTSTGGAWQSLTLDVGRVSGSITDTAATGAIFYTGPGHAFTPVVRYGVTAATLSGSSGTATRQPDGSVRYRFAAAISNLNAGTGAVNVSGYPYSCQTWAFNSVSQEILGGSGLASLTGSPVIVLGSASISLVQSAATGYSALTETNVPVSAIIKGDINCPVQ